MRCLAVAVIVVLLAKLPTSEASKTCKHSSECTGSYKSCCDRKCDYRQYCDNYCSRRSDCASYQSCINNDCVPNKPLNYCDDFTFCPANHRCVKNSCVEDGPGYSCHCAENEKCVEGACYKRDQSESGLSPATIAGFTAMIVMGACVACGIRCIKQTRGQLSSQQREMPAQHLSTQQEVNIDIEATGVTTTGQPIHPGGPPSYDSLERTDGIEEPPPPSYEEAVRNSHNNLNV